MRCKFQSLSALLLAASSTLTANANTNLYPSYEAAKRACGRWALQGETIFVTKQTHIPTRLTYETNAIWAEGEHKGKDMYVYMTPILLRKCEFDYDTTAYFGYQHKGIHPAPEWFPKKADGSDWTYEGRVIRIFADWDYKGGVKVNSFPF